MDRSGPCHPKHLASMRTAGARAQYVVLRGGRRDTEEPGVDASHRRIEDRAFPTVYFEPTSHLQYQSFCHNRSSRLAGS